MPHDPTPRQPEGATTLTIPQALQRALAACQRGDWAEAERICRLVLAARPEQADALNLLGMVALQTRRPREAVEWLSRVLAVHEGHAQARLARASALGALGRHAEALADYDRALALVPDSAEAHLNRGIVLGELGRREEALASCERAAALRPDFALARYNHGLALHVLGRLPEALAAFDRAIALRDDFPDAHNNRGVVLRELGRLPEALRSHERAIALAPASAEAHNNRGAVLRALRRPAQALESYSRAIALRPAFAQAHCNAGNALGDLGRHAEALQCCERAISADPGYVDAHVRRGIALRDLGRRLEALQSYERALALDPAFDWLEGLWLHEKMRVCDWSGLAGQVGHLAGRIERGEKATAPFAVLAMPVAQAVQRTAAQTWVEAMYPARELLPAIAPAPRGGRIRIGYFSADFHEHATSYLVAEVLERHDRARFEVTAYSFGPDTRDAMRARIAAAVERFVDVRELSDEEVARLARGHGIDIAVDLKGFTEDARTGIFALRAAPIQVSYLGYPGTMAAPYVDYLVADATVAPEEHRAHYAESLVLMPGCYQANDSKRRISERAFTRAQMGLPESGFVFCSFNNNFKIAPDTFDAWMRLLGRVEGSVLWLLEDNEWAAANLRAEAGRRGIDAGRLVFARRMPLDEHLARHRLADLFLDTLPYNAHTTASDALWAGLPVLTCLGGTFAGRVAASLLRAVGLPELVVDTVQEYEALALALASDPERLAGLRRRLEANRATAPLFDSARFAANLEAAYRRMVERREAGLAPATFRVRD
ncbi:MAG: tetratricopeptide repeat protein [Betaproteobacteria bacterium]|nr:tetratricopeptide repeat protein [Betaproteobacteria bacterium]